MASDPLTPEHVNFYTPDFLEGEKRGRARAEAELLALRPVRDAALAWQAAEDALAATPPIELVAWREAADAATAATGRLDVAVRALSGQAVSPICTCHWPEPGTYTEGCPVHDRADAAKADRDLATLQHPDFTDYDDD